MYIKDFDGWNEEKKKTTHNMLGPHAYPGDIWHCKIGINVGSETDGKGGYLRPVLVISKIGKMYFIVPLTTKGRKTHLYYMLSSIQKKTPGTISTILLGQCKIIDGKRLFRKYSSISYKELEYIKKLLIDLYLRPYK